jgi:hypothetical protein
MRSMTCSPNGVRPPFCVPYWRLAALVVAHEAVEVAAALHGAHRASRPLDRVVEALRDERAPLVEARPRAQRPPLQCDERGDHVECVSGVPLEVQAERRLRHGREHLQADAPLAPAWQVRVATVARREQVAPPEQRVVVQIDDEQRFVERARPRTGLRRVDGRAAIRQAFDRRRAERGRQGGEQPEDDQQPGRRASHVAAPQPWC